MNDKISKIATMAVPHYGLVTYYVEKTNAGYVGHRATVNETVVSQPFDNAVRAFYVMFDWHAADFWNGFPDVYNDEVYAAALEIKRPNDPYRVEAMYSVWVKNKARKEYFEAVNKNRSLATKKKASKLLFVPNYETFEEEFLPYEGWEIWVDGVYTGLFVANISNYTKSYAVWSDKGFKVSPNNLSVSRVKDAVTLAVMFYMAVGSWSGIDGLTEDQTKLVREAVNVAMNSYFTKEGHIV